MSIEIIKYFTVVKKEKLAEKDTIKKTWQLPM